MQVGGVDHATELAAGLEHTCALTTSGEVYCWGSFEFGQLGDGQQPDTLEPTPISALSCR